MKRAAPAWLQRRSIDAATPGSKAGFGLDLLPEEALRQPVPAEPGRGASIEGERDAPCRPAGAGARRPLPLRRPLRCLARRRMPDCAPLAAPQSCPILAQAAPRQRARRCRGLPRPPLVRGPPQHGIDKVGVVGLRRRQISHTARALAHRAAINRCPVRHAVRRPDRIKFGPVWPSRPRQPIRMRSLASNLSKFSPWTVIEVWPPRKPVLMTMEALPASVAICLTSAKVRP